MAREDRPAETRGSYRPAAEEGAYGDPVVAEPRGNWSRNLLIWLTVALLVGFGIGWGVKAWVNGGNSAQPNAGITVDNLANNPSNYYGSQVVVSGRISSIYNNQQLINNGISANATGPGGFMLSSQVLVVGSNLPQLAKLQQNAQIVQGDIVQVVGTVHQVNVNDINNTYGTTYGNNTFGGFSGPAIYASQINLVPVIPLNNKVNVNTTLNELASNAQAYRSITVTVSGTPNQRLSDHSFTFSSNNGNILVVTPNSTVPQSYNGTVTVQGQVTEPSTAVLKTQLQVQNNSDINTYLGIGANANTDNALSNYKAAIIANNVTMGSSNNG